MNILEETQKYLNEVKAISIKVGNIFTLSGDIGKFHKGEKVTVDNIKPSGNDIELSLSNETGVKDVFYMDKNDNFEELS